MPVSMNDKGHSLAFRNITKLFKMMYDPAGEGEFTHEEIIQSIIRQVS